MHARRFFLAALVVGASSSVHPTSSALPTPTRPNSSSSSTLPSAPLDVSVVGLELIDRVPGFGDQDAYPFANMERSTSIAFLLRSGDWIIDVRCPEFECLRITDDRGRILEGESPFPPHPTERSNDQHSLIFYAHVAGVPLPDATRLRVGGSLEAWVASSSAEAHGTMTARVGSTFELAGVRFEVVDVTRTRDREWPVRVQLEVQTGVESIRSLAFSARGSVVRSRSTETVRYLDGAGRRTRMTYALERRAGTFDVVADVYTDLRPVSVPVDLDIGVGFGRGSSRPVTPGSP